MHRKGRQGLHATLNVVSLSTAIGASLLGITPTRAQDKAACDAKGWTWVESRNPIDAQSSSPSLIAAMTMGAQGFSKVPYRLIPHWDAIYLSSCQLHSAFSTLWFSACDPNGAITTFSSDASNPGQNWTWVQYEADMDSQWDAVKAMIAIMSDALLRSPIVVPMHGRADQFMTLRNFCVQYKDGTTTPKNFDVPTAYDALNKVTVTYSGYDFRFTYYQVMSAIGPNCPSLPGNPPCTDPFLNKFLMFYDPPAGFTLPRTLPKAPPELALSRFPGFLSQGQVMNEGVASQGMRQALRLAKLEQRSDILARLNGGTTLPAYRVVERHPLGEVTDSYFVPVRDGAGKGTLFVSLSSEDGAVKAVYVPQQPQAYSPIDAAQALSLAQNSLSDGETAGEPILSWDAALGFPDVSNPYQPFFEVPISRQGKQTGVLWIAMLTGKVLGRGPIGTTQRVLR